MSLIKKLSKTAINNQEEWWRIAQADPQAGFYQTPAWFEVAKAKSANYADASLMGQLSTGTNFVLPLCSYSRIWPIKRIYSVYDQCYGGLIADGPVTAAEHQAILNAIPLSPFASFDLTQTPGIQHGTALPDYHTETFTGSEIDLTDTTFDEVFAKYTRTHRTNYRKGVKSGLIFRRADPANLAADFDLFYDIYLETLDKRWGENVEGDVLDRDFLHRFEAIMAKYPENFFMWFAELEGKAVSVATAFQWNGRFDGWVMASRPEFFKLRPTVFIITEIIKYAFENNHKLFHFGPNTGKQGLEDFKRRFGAVAVPYQTWHRPSPALSLLEKIRG